jgi:multidrug resistance efflux pump
MNKLNRMVFTMKIRPIYLIVLLALLLTACQSVNAMESTTTPPPVVTGDAAVTVEGKLTPAEFVDLSFNMPGVISEVLVDEGQPVQKDQVIARLDQGPRLASAVAAAELELVNAQQAMKALNDTSEVNTSSAAQKVATARDAVRYAERRLNNLKSGSRGTDVEKAAANVVLLKDRLDKAREDFAPYENKPEDNVTRATYQSRLADAQRKYDDAVLLLNNLQGTPSDIDLAIAEANLSLAQAQLALAESDYAEVKGGPDPDALQAAQARLNAAETGLTAAQAALSDSELKAPFTGTLVRLDIKAGEQAVPAKPAAVLADLSHWVVETDDLNEMEVPSIQEGQPVQLIPDSLPEMVIDGHVESISQIYEEKYGDVTYTVRIALDEIDPRLRWGMTMKARFGE